MRSSCATGGRFREGLLSYLLELYLIARKNPRSLRESRALEIDFA